MFDDSPMSLGDHLEELRDRLLKVVAVLFVGVVVGMIFQVELKIFIEQPLRRAIGLADPESVARIGLQTDPDKPIFRLDHLAESAINAVKVSFFAALTLAFPVLIYQLWAFVRPALKRNEASAGFLFVPLAVIFFYAGVVFGYTLGLPFLYKLLIEWTANENAILDLRQTYYLSFFVMMTLAFGFIMDIPWLVMVLVRMRVMTPDQIAAKRRMIVLIGAIVAAVATPPDPVSQLAMFGLVVVLFEGGLLASRFLYRAPEQVTDEMADAVPPVEAEGAPNDGTPPWAEPEPGDSSPPADDEVEDMGYDHDADHHPADDELEGHPASEDAVDDDGLGDDGPVSRPSAWDRAGETGEDPGADDDGAGDDSDDGERR